MSNTISETEITITYEWRCPSCGYYNVGSELCHESPKEGGLLYCITCSAAYKITKCQTAKSPNRR